MQSKLGGTARKICPSPQVIVSIDDPGRRGFVFYPLAANLTPGGAKELEQDGGNCCPNLKGYGQGIGLTNFENGGLENQNLA